MNQEPTVWDYVRSRILFWRGARVAIPVDELRSRVLELPVAPEDESRPETPTQPPAVIWALLRTCGTAARAFHGLVPSRSVLSRTLAPWRLTRALAPLLLALCAQLALEPPRRSVGSALMLYALAVAWIVWAAWRGEWQLAARCAPHRCGWEDGSVRRSGLMASGVLGLAAFVALGGNRFTSLNVTLWALSLVAFLWAVWQLAPDAPRWTERVHSTWEGFLAHGVRLSPWMLLVLAAFALTVFLRLHMLDQVPKEMISDHAEQLLDVADVLDGQYSVFFPRNSGREAFQMYLTAAIALMLGSGLSFACLKLSTALAGILTLPFIYLTGKEIANRRVGLLAMVFAGISYWPNVISRVALPFTLYPFFFAPMLYFLVRGLRRRSRNDLILAGLLLGLGLHGYSPYRFVPLTVLAAWGLYLVHRQSQGARRLSLGWLALAGSNALIVFLPLGRYWLADPHMFSYRAMSRMTGVEQPLSDPAWQIFLKNTWDALTMFFWDNGEIWVHSIPHRPALDVVSASLFFSGAVLLVVRYLHKRDWLDIFLLVSIPLLMMPSILSLAFPGENPCLNRTGAAMVPVFLLVGRSLDGWMTTLEAALKLRWRRAITVGAAVLLLWLSIRQNYDLVFRQYRTQFARSTWNASELGAVIRQFAVTVGSEGQAWVIAYPHWVDTRLVGVTAGSPRHDYAIWPDQLEDTLDVPSPKQFLFKPEDTEALTRLRRVYPDGVLSLYESPLEGKEFHIFFVPPDDR